MTGIGVFFLALVTSVVTAASSVYLIERYQLLDGGALVTVPNLRGLNETEARDNLRAVGLVYLAAPSEVSSSAKPGAVARQSIPPGQSVPRHHPVGVALAQELTKVPNVLGLPETEAIARLERAGYRAQQGEPLASASVPEGQVAKQNPASETPLERERSVLYQVSIGQGLVEVPKLTGMSVNAAKLELEKLGLKPNIRWISAAETTTFLVLQQKPEARTQVKPGADVDLVANR